MKTVTLEVRSPEAAMSGFAKAWRSGTADTSARIVFATPDLLWQVLTAKRWELLKILCGAGTVSIREAARRVGRDVKAVHGDVTALLNAGILERAEAAAERPDWCSLARCLRMSRSRNSLRSRPPCSPHNL